MPCDKLEQTVVMLELRESGGQWHSWQHSLGMHPHIPSTECAEIMVKLCRRHCLRRVNVTCNKFDNNLYILKTGYQLETGLPFFEVICYKNL